MCPLTRSCFLLLLLRSLLLACPPSPPCYLPSFTVEPTLSSLCSCSDPTLSSQDVALTHLDSLLPHDLYRLLFLFLLAKMALVYLFTSLYVELRQLSSFRQTQYAKVFLLKPVPFCKLICGLSCTNKSSTSLIFLS